ncbi:ribosomal protein L7/L12 [Streptomyces sp. 15-116A]|uniref:ribosomal protein L7/L12 n=1 Tax=Streptomyces sp. 15-116A TaxID=2259035 RepID=UPI0021B45E66|nr:ribosomal protein L7/L12 [Streptomyces sp. 15-116A]MCT7355483.1 ribosomal protein L7/L12 [Streptomyces sp. 15-116A]
MDIAALLLVCGAIFSIATLQSNLSRTERRIARVERKLDLVLDHLGLHEELPRGDEIAGLLREGRKVQAIKVYREVTGAGLVEAKEAVERMA